jgi:hypothetical protein
MLIFLLILSSVASSISVMEQVETISKDILQKLSEVKEGSDAQKFLLIKKKILDRGLDIIINEAQVNVYEYELYTLLDKSESLRYKITMKERRPADDDEDMKEFRQIKEQMNWIRQTKLKGVKLTDVQRQIGR